MNGTWVSHTLNNVTTSKCSCFTADTLVALEDGSEKPIHEIRVGDRLIGRDGKINTVLELDHALLWKGKPQHLVSINGGKAFMTDNHPVLTTEGWKAINSYTGVREAYDILSGRLGTLKAGDTILLKGGKSLKVETIALMPQAKTSKRLYNFVLDGDHTYTANGFVVMGMVPDKAGRYTVSHQHDGEPADAK